MMSRSVLALFLCAALPVAARLSANNNVDMRPEVVSQLLVSVERNWESSRLDVFRNATDAQVALSKMEQSCIKVASSIIQGSEGDKDRVVEYFETVCDDDKSTENKEMCQQFAQGVTGAMSDDQQYNRDELNLHGFCQKFWEGTVTVAAKVQSQKMDEEVAVQKAKKAEEEKARKEQEAEEEKARKEKEAVEETARKEKEAVEERAHKEKVELEAKAQKEKVEAEATARKEKAEAEAKALAEKHAEEEKALNEKADAEAKALTAKHVAEAKALKEKAEAEAKALTEKQAVLVVQQKEAEQLEVAKAENQTASAEKDIGAAAQTEKVAEKDEAKMAVDDKEATKLVETAHKAMALAAFKQDPCAGCAEAFVAQHQKCMATMSNNPCTKQYTGVAFDNQCCGMAQQHARCMSCKSQGSRPHYNSKWTDQLNSGVTVTEGYSK